MGGMGADVCMTATHLGEAPYLFTPGSIATTSPLVVAVRVAGDPATSASRVRAIAADLNAGLGIAEIRPPDEVAWRVDLPMMIGAGAIVAVVTLGLFLSAAGIFALMSVSVARRT